MFARSAKTYYKVTSLPKIISENREGRGGWDFTREDELPEFGMGRGIWFMFNTIIRLVHSSLLIL